MLHRQRRTSRPLRLGLLLLVTTASCGAAPRAPEAEAPVIRWLAPSETGPHGSAPGAQARLLTTQADGTKTYVVILTRGDEVLTSLVDFAKAHQVVNAHFVAIGAVRDPEVGWFDPARKQYKGMTLHEQMEVLTLAGDIALGVGDQPVTHAHVALGRSDGRAWGGHLLQATASPTLELYVTTYPEALRKRLDPATDLQLIDPSLGR
jgi:predicted DNA-binding protein with PD1-like motif